ncbi:MAG TPA: DUF1549 and DUF1553 domain-containing protein [Pirellulales bacterium]|nr:DUF1549 and DUF1553 domain-containing protein [Pirellulales bacterium]
MFPSRQTVTVRCVVAAVAGLAAAQCCWAAELSPTARAGERLFQPPRRPAAPSTRRADWVANPIDAFILRALEEQDLGPNPPADKLTLLRRVTFDLTGLPPTLAEQRAFLDDDASDAYGRVVDRLLDSPQYGERWAQHWLDVVRYAETDGFKEDAARANAYRYRDYVIRAFNEDLPYDRFIRQQLAGDELEPDNPEALVATGLNRLYPDEYNAADVRARRQQIHDDLTEATGLAFLGLTIGCAQCHDHKFDPISQVDYYRLQAFFSPLLPRDDLPIATAAERRAYAERLADWERATQSIRDEIEGLLAPARAAVLKESLLKFEPDVRQAVETPAETRTAVDRQLAVQAMKYVTPKLSEIPRKLENQTKERYDDLVSQLGKFDHLKPSPLPTAMAVTDAAAEPPPTYRLVLGNYKKPLEEVRPGFPACLGESEPHISATPGRASTGRRAALAEWLARGDHPLTSRVMVNRLWQHHFGRGIVATPNDFGATGEAASHPELLDWLAIEFVERGWSMKAMHRLMVTSSTYRQSSHVDFDLPRHARALERDGANRLLWHARRVRLEGEAIRDAMLRLSGQLNPQLYGRSARPELPAGIDTKVAWKPDEEAPSRDRRSVYVFAKRNFRYPLLDVFDLPDMHNSCPQRSATVTAPQALALMNGEFSQEQARHWSGRLLSRREGNLALAVGDAFAEALGRAASEEQMEAAGRFLSSQASTIAAAGQASDQKSQPTPAPTGIEPATASAMVDFCHALLNSNEFLFID